MTDDQPVPDHFWDGSFTLGAAPGPVPAPGTEEDGTEDGTALDALGPSGIRLGGRDLTAVLTTAYRRMTGPEPGVR